MTKLLRLAFAVVIAFALHSTASSQSLSVNTTGATANASSILDVSSTNKGVLIPRMDKTQKNAIASPATGLLVFQTAPDSVGFHYYDGIQWIYLAVGSADSTSWKINGNGNIKSSNFLGTTNDSALRFRVRNINAGMLDSTSANTSFGYRSMTSITTGTGNTMLGYRAGYLTDTAKNNVIIGYYAGEYNKNDNNVAIGQQAGRYYSYGGGTPARMTALGTEALHGIWSGEKNTSPVTGSAR